MSRPEPPPGADEPVFAEPWQADAFALVVALHAGGHVDWSEWTRLLGEAVHRPGVAADGSDYYESWLDALEALARTKGIATSAEIDTLAAAWQRAAHATPHGQPIRLENDPQRRA